jgi:hypothetical protein
MQDVDFNRFSIESNAFGISQKSSWDVKALQDLNQQINAPFHPVLGGSAGFNFSA